MQYIIINSGKETNNIKHLENNAHKLFKGVLIVSVCIYIIMKL